MDDIDRRRRQQRELDRDARNALGWARVMSGEGRGSTMTEDALYRLDAAMHPLTLGPEARRALREERLAERLRERQRQVQGDLAAARELLDRLQAGDMSAYNALVEAYYRCPECGGTFHHADTCSHRGEL